MKSAIYHLIILDESGSMSGVRSATISGCNETLNTIRSTQKEFADTQDHFVSIYVFQGGSNVPSRYIFKNVPIADVNDITPDHYNPWGNTPLLDAVGSTLVDLKLTTDQNNFAIGNVTIITDGYENSSHVYTYEKVTKMIDALKELGWLFSFIGANIDVAQTATSLHIDNSLAFKQDDDGTRAMFAREATHRRSWTRRHHDIMQKFMSKGCEFSEEDAAEMRADFKESNSDYFNE